MRNGDVGPAVHHQLSGTQAAQTQRWRNGHTLSTASAIAFNLAGTLNLFPSAKSVTPTLKQAKAAKKLISGKFNKRMFHWVSQQSNLDKITGNKRESRLGV